MHAIVSVELPYADWCNAEELFAPFAQEQGAILLDSAAAEHPDSRFDFLFRQPETSIQIDDATCCRNQSPINQTPEDPFTQIQRALDALAPYEGNPDLPFQGGAAGYFSYDLGRATETLPQQAIRDIPLPDMSVGIYTRALIIDHKSKRVHAICPASERHQVESFWKSSKRDKQSQPSFKLTGDWQSNMSRADYFRKIEQVHHYLLAGDCYQINLAQRFSAPCEGNPWFAYQTLRHTNSAPFSGYITVPNGAILSVSPERFLQTHSSRCVETRPIKGTRPRRADMNEDNQEKQALLTSEKDQAENLMIVDLLRNDLSRVCAPGTVHVPELFKLESFKAVHHLVSTVRGKLDSGMHPTDLLRAAFPGGSITGAPKVRAMEIIEELEPHRRSVYCGSIGYISQHGHMDTNITIRTLCVADNTIHCWAGGGIVADSEASAEYQETLDKVNRILPVLQ